MTWKDAEFEKPKGDQTILVSWKDSDGRWNGPIRAYYEKNVDRYYSIDTIRTVPLDIDIWHPIPEFPEEDIEEKLCDLCKACQCGKKT